MHILQFFSYVSFEEIIMSSIETYYISVMFCTSENSVSTEILWNNLKQYECKCELLIAHNRTCCEGLRFQLLNVCT